ncbi:MAG: hypothetical protein FWG79_05160 [Bacteroidales bacterium]|nr:hypothetical protein [Bacteroidales bacterium]
MKKLILPLVTFGILFNACNKDKNEESKKLVSKITYSWMNNSGPGSSADNFEYDDQNRLVKYYWTIEGSTERRETTFVYSGNSNTPTKLVHTNKYYGEEEYSYEELFEYVGNQVLRISSGGDGSDTLFLTVDANGRVTKENYGARSSSEYNFVYNSNGNIEKRIYSYIDWEDGTPVVSELILTYSDVKSVFRHANVTDWLMWLRFNVLFSKSGYMLGGYQSVGQSGITNFAYTVDADGYALTRVETFSEGSSSETATFTYINAK